MRTADRCGWADTGNAAYVAYHDEEWGAPVLDDRRQFEFLILEGAQAGLSWATVLGKRTGYREAFAGFDPRQVARFQPARVERLLQNPAIIRNRQKIAAAVTNARAFLAVQESFGSFASYIWEFVGGVPVQNAHREPGEVPATSPVSDAMSRDMRQRGFKFAGSTIMYAHMQATGLVNDHLISCFRHAECARLAERVGNDRQFQA
ncbi:DNA-3-methyladenine glycosylase I [soil metagenome]